MAPRHFQSPNFNRKPYGHDNSNAKGEQWEIAIEEFFSRLISKLKFWK